VLGQGAIGLRLSLGLRLGRDVWRWGWCGCLDRDTAGARLHDGLGCWNRLATLARGDRDATCHDRGGGDAQTCARDEIAPGHYGSSGFSSVSGL
jgi:hypothetical protein